MSLNKFAKEEENKDKMVLMYLYNDTNLVNKDVRGRQQYYDMSDYNFEHRYEGEKNYSQHQETYPNYMYQNFGSWGQYALTKSFPKPKMFSYNIRTRMKNDDSCQIGVSYKALEEMIHDDLVLHVAILEDGVPNSFESSSLGEKIDTCDNILRKMLPNSDGTFLGAVSLDDSGDAVLSFDRADINLVNMEKSRLVVFIQSRNGKIIYETKRFNNHPFQELGEWADTPNLVAKPMCIKQDLTVRKTAVHLKTPLMSSARFELVNSKGQVLYTSSFSSGVTIIPLPAMSKGVYVARLSDIYTSYSKRFVLR